MYEKKLYKTNKLIGIENATRVLHTLIFQLYNDLHNLLNLSTT